MPAMALLSIAVKIKQVRAEGKGSVVAHGQTGAGGTRHYSRRDAGASKSVPDNGSPESFWLTMRKLRCLGDVGSLRTLLSLGDLELDLITFLKTLVAFRGDRAVV